MFFDRAKFLTHWSVVVGDLEAIVDAELLMFTKTLSIIEVAEVLATGVGV